MKKYIDKRFLQLIPVLLGITFLPSMRNMGVEALLMRSSRVQTCCQISGSAWACMPRARRVFRSHWGRAEPPAAMP